VRPRTLHARRRDPGSRPHPARNRAQDALSRNWSGTYRGEKSITQGLYYNFGNDALNFAMLFQDSMNEAIEDMQSQLPGIAAALGERN
jgi:hypothetical protein